MPGVYTVANGQIFDPNGKRFLAVGPNIDNSVPAATILGLFPRISFVRVPIAGFDQPAEWEPLLSTLMNAGVVCEVEHHPWPLVDALAGQDLVAESAFYATWGAYAVGKPKLWLGSMNEPQGGDLSAQHAATYAAIRGTGNLNPIMLMCGVGGGNPGGVGAASLDPSIYAAMHGIIWDLHFYGWVTDSTDQATVNGKLLGSLAGASGILAAQGIRSADGLVPVIIGETGPSTDGSNQDANAAEVEYAVTTWAWTQGLTQGFAGWHLNLQADALTVNGKRTAWGNTLNAACNAGAASMVTTPPPPAATPSPDKTIITPGSGTIIDTLGNQWTVTPGGTVAVNGATDTTTSGVTQMAYVAGVVWQENGHALWWGKSSPAAAWAPPAGTAVSPLAATPPPTPKPTPTPTAPPVSGVTHLTVAAKVGQVGALLTQANTLMTSILKDLITLTP